MPKLNRWVVAEHPGLDTVLLAFGEDTEKIPAYGFSIKPEDAIEIGEQLIAFGKRILERGQDGS